LNKAGLNVKYQNEQKLQETPGLEINSTIIRLLFHIT